MFSKQKNIKLPSRFKGRKQPKISWANPPLNRRTYVYYIPGGNMEVDIVKHVLEEFRRIVKRRRYKLNFLTKPSYMVFRKSKNSRMGKGKGRFKRWSFNFKKNQLFMVFTGVSHTRVVWFFRRISNILRRRFTITHNRNFR